MICSRPYVIGAIGFGCGQCIPCRIMRSRVWAARMELESYMHDASSFVTLTYDEEHVPASGSLVPRDAQLWLKRLRKALQPRPIRFYLCGEYGETTQRPHYHAALFGVGVLDTDAVHSSWGMGFTKVGDLTPKSARYVAGYIMKKLDTRATLNADGRIAEFSRMSLRPGIGVPAIATLAKQYATPEGRAMLSAQGDVTGYLQRGRSRLPLGRTMLAKLREAVGMTPDDIQAIKDELTAEESADVLSLLAAALPTSPAATPKKVIMERDAGRIIRAETLARRTRGTL